MQTQPLVRAIPNHLLEIDKSLKIGFNYIILFLDLAIHL